MTPDPNSALYWLPRIEAAGLQTPKTIMVPFDHRAVIASMEGDGSAGTPPPLKGVLAAAEAIGGTVFIRGDHTSAKHDGPRRYKWANGQDPTALSAILYGIVEDTEMKLWLSADLSESAFMVRQFLDLEAGFDAFGRVLGEEGRVGHPIAREWRFFARNDGVVVCAHPYWTPDAFAPEQRPWGVRLVEGRMEPLPGPEGWEAALTELEKPLPMEEMVHLLSLAGRAAKACPDGAAWSVDFARDRSGTWWLIDMALAADSHHRPCGLNTFNPKKN